MKTLIVEDVNGREAVELCDVYLMKPIDLSELLKHLKAYQLVP